MPAMTILRLGQWFTSPEFWRAKRDGRPPKRPPRYPKSREVINPDVAVFIRAGLAGLQL
jgi:hypothetical protein